MQPLPLLGNSSSVCVGGAACKKNTVEYLSEGSLKQSTIPATLKVKILDDLLNSLDKSM